MWPPYHFISARCWHFSSSLKVMIEIMQKSTTSQTRKTFSPCVTSCLAKEGKSFVKPMNNLTAPSLAIFDILIDILPPWVSQQHRADRGRRATGDFSGMITIGLLGALTGKLGSPFSEICVWYCASKVLFFCLSHIPSPAEASAGDLCNQWGNYR